MYNNLISERDYMLKPELSDKEIFDIVSRFLIEHPQDYSKEEQKLILNNCLWGRHSSVVTDILRQIYDELNLLEEDKNVYNQFLHVLEQKFSINTDIVEIGGGRIPNLSKKIALRQTSGTITTYDNQLIIPQISIPNWTLVKRRLLPNEQLKAKLLIGFMPCEGTETAISLVKENHLDFMIALCGGVCHSEGSFLTPEEWASSMIYDAKQAAREAGLGEVKKTYIKGSPYPIIYNRR